MEFRSFCVEGKLTCICQYAHEIIFSELKDEKNPGRIPAEIVKRILDFWEGEKIGEKLVFKTCCVDFAVLPDKVMIIEINPLDVYTGSALFNWNKDADIVVDGIKEEPFVETRVALLEHRKGCVYAEWEDLIRRTVAEFRKERGILQKSRTPDQKPSNTSNEKKSK